MIQCIKNTEATLNQKFVFGFINGEPVQSLLIKDDLDPADVIIYDDYNSLFTDNMFSSIANTADELDMDCFQPNVVSEGRDTLDYATMDPSDQAKVDAFVLLVERKNELPIE